jgi:2-polyprenyl-3-methyl-5-hydroxy-6-metoxy-1,4-benzoquinol methylase
MGTFDFNKDAEILIYGYGKAGQDLHRRLVEQGYRVIGIIDKNAERFAPVYNCVFIKPEELDAESAGHIIVLTLQNILEHERVVKMLAARGAEKIVYLNHSGPETYQTCFRIYNQLIYGKTINDFEFPLTTIEFEPERGSYYREEAELIIVEVPAPILFKKAESQPWQNINITAFKGYNALYGVLLHGKYDSPEDFKSYCDIQCGSDRTMEVYLQDRSLLCQMMQAEFMNYGLSFFRNAPSTARWNRGKGCFNLVDGHHRASFLANNHVHTIPIRISVEDYEFWYNSAIAEKCRVYIEEQHIESTYTPIYHPAFCDIDYSAEKGGGLTASALYQFFGGKAVTDMSVLDVNSSLSYFAQIFARMGAAQIVSAEPRKELFELAKLLNQLHYTDTIEMHNDNVEELDVQDNYDVVIIANDLLPDFHTENAGKQLLQKIDSLSSAYFISRSYADNDEERRYILATSRFKSYHRLNIEIIEGKLSEVGVYKK